MRATEFIVEGVAEGSLEEVDRRGFLKGVGAAAVAGAAGSAIGKEIPSDGLDSSTDPLYIAYYCWSLSGWLTPQQEAELKKFPLKSDNGREKAYRDSAMWVTRAMKEYGSSNPKTDKIIAERATMALNKLKRSVQQGVAEGLNELTNTSLKVKQPKDFVNTNDRKQVTWKVMKFKSGKDTYLINFTMQDPPAFGKKSKSNWNAVNVAFGVKEPQDEYSFGDEINTDLTARNKNQFLIYSTVINAIRKFITEYNTEIDEIIMQGAGERQQAMYQRFFQSAGKYFPGWHYNGKYSLVRDVPRQPIKKVREQGVAEGFSNDMSTEDMIAYLRQHHDTNLHQDYLNHLNTFSKFVLKDIPTNTLKTDLPGLDREKVEQYKKMDQSKAPPIVLGGKYILDGYHRANAVKELGIPTIKAYVGITTK